MFKSVLRMLLRMEHWLYCATRCQVEFPLHKLYYRKRKEKYTTYLKINKGWFPYHKTITL